MAFIDSRLPTKVELNAVRRDVEDIEIITTDGLWEVRNARHSQSLREFEISFPAGKFDDTTIAAVVSQYKVCRGQLHAFRFKDPLDFQLTSENIGTGDGSDTTFQITQKWTVGSDTFTRNITRPVSGISVYKAGVLQTITTQYTISLSTGVITFLSAPANGAAITVTGTFDIPVRFDEPLPMTALTGTIRHIDTITLKEVRE